MSLSSSSSSRLWILGAPDPEMAEIEQLLLDCGERVAYATIMGPDPQVGYTKRRVRGGEAYGNSVSIADGSIRGWDTTAYCVECRPAVLYGSDIESIDWAGMVHTIDHHCPGDPGYGRSPKDFLIASSIGQVVSHLARLHVLGAGIPQTVAPVDARPWLTSDCDLSIPEACGTLVLIHQDWVPDEDPLDYWVVAHGDGYWSYIPDTVVYAAAADHCLTAAYRGECPGVKPDDLMRWRVSTRAAHQGRSSEEILADIGAARKALRSAERMSLGSIDANGNCRGCGQHVQAISEDDSSDYCTCPACQDMRGCHWPELPEASAREGICFVTNGLPAPDGRVKVICQSGTPEQINAFMRVWAPADGLVNIYGDPARGFAGGYLP